jgi:hypothetical protein
MEIEGKLYTYNMRVPLAVVVVVPLHRLVRTFLKKNIKKTQ